MPYQKKRNIKSISVLYFSRYILNIILENLYSKKRKKLGKTSEKYLFLK